MKIEIAGPGCVRCKETEKNVLAALKEMGIKAEVSKVTDIREMSQKGVMITPSVIVDGVVKVSGKIPTVQEIKNILSEKK